MQTTIMQKRKSLRLNFSRSNVLLWTVFILIWVSNDTFMFGTNSNSLMVEIPRILMGIVIVIEILYFLAKYKKIPLGLSGIVGLAMVGLMVGISFYHDDATKLIVIKCLCILSSLLLTLHYTFREYAEAFVKVMVFLSIMALILEVIAYVVPSLVYALPRVLNTANNQISTIGLAGFPTEYLQINFIRAFGIFWEPGVFQIYLNIALMIELFTRKNISWRNVFLLCASVIITFSTTGYIVTAWILLSYFLIHREKSFTKKSMIMTLFVMAVALVAFFLLDFTFIYENVFDKLSDTQDGSTIARSASVFVNLDIFFDYPLFGIGMGNMNAEMVTRSLYMYGKSTVHNTNTLLYQFAAHGIFYGGLFAFGTFRCTRCFSSRKSLQLAIAVAVILLYVGENLRYSMLPFILIFYGFSSEKQ